jgi:hypothetical protein
MSEVPGGEYVRMSEIAKRSQTSVSDQRDERFGFPDQSQISGGKAKKGPIGFRQMPKTACALAAKAPLLPEATVSAPKKQNPQIKANFFK